MSSGKLHPLRIDTTTSEAQEFRFSLDTTSPFTPANNPAPDIPSFRLSASTSNVTTPIELVKSLKPTSNDRARSEGRKLLAHVLTQLRNRPMPPSVSDTIGTFREAAKHSWNFKEIVKAQIVKLDRGKQEIENSDDEAGSYSTDTTFNLMLQLQELLVMSLEQQWHIFDDSGLPQDPVLSDSNNKLSSPFRRSRGSFYNSGRKSRSPSPGRIKNVFVPELLSQCISVLASVVAEDCRFQNTSPRPFCPPNALQVLALNVAQVLLHINSHDPRTTSQIALALVPAFSTFNKEMHPRLIYFFDQGIMRNSLSNLRRLQGFDSNQSATDASVSHPLVSIHVDEVAEDGMQNEQHLTWSPWTLTDKTLKIQSTNAPAQPLPVYYLSAMVPPLLGTALDNVELEALDEKDLRTVQILLGLLRTIVDQKVDAYSDILQVVAYHTPKARKFGVTLLSSFWPQSVGHAVVSQLPVNWSAHKTLFAHNLPYEHQFVPWYFRHRHDWFSPGDSSQHDCHACRKPVHGFGLLCPYCTWIVHLDCYDYPGGSALVQYTNASDPHVQRIAMYRFSKVHESPPNPQATAPPSSRPHQFHRVNLFTLSLCFICRRPLWGCTSQGFRCSSCSRLVHDHCLSGAAASPCGSTGLDLEDLTIRWSALQQTCLEQYGDILSLSHRDLARKSYEEISIFRDILSTQVHLLNHGLKLGSFLLIHKGVNIDNGHQSIPVFELHRTVKWCEELLSTDNLYASPAIEEYLQENGLFRRDHSMLYTWTSLIYVVASMKSPSTALNPSRSTSSDFLNVTQIDSHPDVEAEDISHPFDMVSLSHMRDVLGHEFHIHSDAAAQLLLSHLHQLAFFESGDRETFSNLANMRKNKSQSCTFPLPLGLDLSIDVEVLVSAIEACLSDIDLYVNEFGFLLLTRRTWPDGLMSDYGLKRLARSVFAWIIHEDDHLAAILRDFLGKNRPLPGIRASRTASQWPSAYHERPVHSGPAQNGGDYLAGRQTLLQRYANRWLLALHNQDVDLYANSLFNACDELADHGSTAGRRGSSYRTQVEDIRLIQYERILHHILRLTQAHVLFSVSDTIYLRWLDLVHSHEVLDKDVCLITLMRLFPRNSDHRGGSVVVSATGESFDRSFGLETDPWQVIIGTAQRSKEGRTKGLSWLNLLCRSGIEVPLNIYEQFIAELAAAGNPLEESCLFIKAMMASLWLRSLGRHQYQTLLAKFHLSLVFDVHKWSQQPSTRPIAYDIVRCTFVCCLLLYGCERAQLVSVGLVTDEYITMLPSRRKLSRETAVMETVFVDPAIMKSIELHLRTSSEYIISMVAKFLYTFLTSSLLEAHELDNFVLRNGHVLSECAWQFYVVQRPDISKIRTSFLLRILSVNTEHFDDLLAKWFSQNQEWERRALAASRLFRIIQDVCSPAFNLDGRQWKSNIIIIFQRFFSLHWSDSKEEVRLVVKSHCSSLLPAHLEAITSCFDETILRSPIADRIKLLSFLMQLRVYFHTWQVLSWDTILEALAESSEYDQQLYQDGTRGDGHVCADPELAQLKVSLVGLALDMISNGIRADGLTLIKIKEQLVRTLGFQNVSFVPTGINGSTFHLAYSVIKSVSELAYPCLGQLVSLLDSWHKIELPPSIISTSPQNDDQQVEILIGTVYADVPLNLLATFEEILELPVLIIKHVLEAVHVIIYKHDFENRNLNVFSNQLFKKVIARTLDVLEADVPHEVRQVAFSLAQTFIKRSTNLTSQVVLDVTERILRLIAAQINQPFQDSLVDQGYNFVEDTLNKYSKSGLFINLLKRSLQKEFFLALKHTLELPKSIPSTLKDDLIWDTFSRLHETENHLLQNLLRNVQQFVEFVHHDKYSTEMMGFVGKQLIHLAQRMSDGSSHSVDASPLLNISSVLLRYNRSNSKELLVCLDTLLRITLVRLQVDSNSISQLFFVTTSLRRKAQVQDAGPTANNTMLVVFDILGDGLRLKTRLLATTLKSILDALTTVDVFPPVIPVALHTPLFIGLVDGGYHWLDNYYWVEGQTEQDFHASLAVAKMIFQVMAYDGTGLQGLSSSEKHGRIQIRLRSWNVLAITALSDTKDNRWATQLFKQLKSFSATYLSTLSSYMKLGGPIPDSATAEINQAYLGIKLWLIVARQSEEARRIGEPVYDAVWNELWPPFENIVTVLETEAEGGVSPIMTGFVASSIADLFSFIRVLRIPISLQKSGQKVMLKRLQSLVKGESVLIKLNRTLGGLAEMPPDIPLETLIDEAAKDIIATEKLRLLDSKREPIRMTGDRRTNVEKKATTDRLYWKEVKPHG